MQRTGVDMAQVIQAGYLKRFEAKLFKRLAEGTLLSSAIDEVADPSHPRVLVHPSLYDADTVMYDGYRRAVIASGRTLRNVEIFETNEIPTNVTRLPDWLGSVFRSVAGGRTRTDRRRRRRGPGFITIPTSGMSPSGPGIQPLATQAGRQGLHRQRSTDGTSGCTSKSSGVRSVQVGKALRPIRRTFPVGVS